MTDTHDEIVRLEARIDELADKLESCRKFVLTGRVAVAGGAVILLAMIFGVIRLDPAMMAVAGAAMLGGIVAAGSNSSTAKEAAAEMTTAEGSRAALIDQIRPRVVPRSETPH